MQKTDHHAKHRLLEKVFLRKTKTETGFRFLSVNFFNLVCKRVSNG